MSNLQQIGKRLKLYREKLNLTVADLAARTGVSELSIQGFEAGTASASIGVMTKLSRALGQRVGTFMDDQDAKDPLITRLGDRNKSIDSYQCNEDGHYRSHALGAGKADRHMEPFYVKFSPVDKANFSSHEGEEFVVVIAGELELIYGNETHVLQQGDTMYYNSIVPHSLRAIGGDVEIYAVVYNT
ncbi:MAG: XRE family transcriptional regulator [Desulfotalea sp.]